MWILTKHIDMKKSRDPLVHSFGLIYLNKLSNFLEDVHYDLKKYMEKYKKSTAQHYVKC